MKNFIGMVKNIHTNYILIISALYEGIEHAKKAKKIYILFIHDYITIQNLNYSIINKLDVI